MRAFKLNVASESNVMLHIISNSPRVLVASYIVYIQSTVNTCRSVYSLCCENEKDIIELQCAHRAESVLNLYVCFVGVMVMECNGY